MNISKTFQDGSYIMETVLKENIYLNNTEAPLHPDYGVVDYIIAKAGEAINIWVRPFRDGRVYYTAYRKNSKGVYYTLTHMKKNGKLVKNCGGRRASFELAKRFKK